MKRLIEQDIKKKNAQKAAGDIFFGNSQPNRTKFGRFMAWETDEEDVRTVKLIATGNSLMGDTGAKNVDENLVLQQPGTCPDWMTS